MGKDSIKGFKVVTISEEYVSALQKRDPEVKDTVKDKKTRPYVGILFTIDKRNYFAPLTTRKPKHETMKDNLDINILRNRQNKCLGAIDFAKMIPVPSSQVEIINFTERKLTHPKSFNTLLNQLYAVNKMKPLLIEKAENLYQKYIDKTLPKNIRKHCVNFEEANKVHDRWVERENIYKKDNLQDNKKDTSKNFSR